MPLRAVHFLEGIVDPNAITGCADTGQVGPAELGEQRLRACRRDEPDEGWYLFDRIINFCSQSSVGSEQISIAVIERSRGVWFSVDIQIVALDRQADNFVNGPLYRLDFGVDIMKRGQDQDPVTRKQCSL